MKKKTLKPYVGFIAPGFILYTMFIIIPILCAIYFSFFDWSGIGPMKFCGLDNFKRLLFDPRTSKIFFNALGNNLKYVLCVWLVITPTQILFAYLVHIKIRAHKYLQLMIFLPYVISTSIIGFFSMIVFDPNIGLLNNIFGSMGLDNLKSAWFGDPKLAFPLLVGIILWQGLGSGMMIFYANMKEIPESIIEASVIDGCGELNRFFRIVLPLLVPSLTTNLVLGTIWGLTQFDIPFLIGGPQGGINNSIDFVNLFFYRSTFGSTYFGETSLGFGASISVAMFLFIFTVSLIQTKTLKRSEYEY